MLLPSPAVDGYIREKKKQKKTFFFGFSIFSMKMIWICLELWLDKILLLNMLFSS